EEDAARAAGFSPMREVEILVTPLFEPGVVARVVRIAGPLQGRVEVPRIFFAREDRREVRPAAEPTPGGHNVSGIHMDSGNVRILRVCHHGNPARPEAWVFRGAW